MASLKSTTSKDKITMPESLLWVLIYAPVDNSYALQLTETDWQNDKALTQLFVSDADGIVEVSITEGNEDMDEMDDSPLGFPQPTNCLLEMQMIWQILMPRNGSDLVVRWKWKRTRYLRTPPTE